MSDRDFGEITGQLKLVNEGVQVGEDKNYEAPAMVSDPETARVAAEGVEEKEQADRYRVSVREQLKAEMDKNPKNVVSDYIPTFLQRERIMTSSSALNADETGYGSKFELEMLQKQILMKAVKNIKLTSFGFRESDYWKLKNALSEMIDFSPDYALPSYLEKQLLGEGMVTAGACDKNIWYLLRRYKDSQISAKAESSDGQAILGQLAGLFVLREKLTKQSFMGMIKQNVNKFFGNFR